MLESLDVHNFRCPENFEFRPGKPLSALTRFREWLGNRVLLMPVKPFLFHS